MTLQEIQKLIDNKDWDNFPYDNKDWYRVMDELVFEKDFILDFIISKGYIIHYYLKNILKRKDELNIILEKEEWIKLLYFADNSTSTGLKLTVFSNITGKDPNHLVLWLDSYETYYNTEYSEFTTVTINPLIFKNFSKDECRKIIKNLFTTELDYKFEDCDESIILDYFTVEEIIEIYQTGNFILQIGLIFQHKTFSEFKKILKNILKKPNSLPLSPLFKYFEKNKNIKLSNEFIEEYINCSKYFTNNLTEEQLEKFLEEFPMDTLLLRTDITIEQLDKRISKESERIGKEVNTGTFMEFNISARKFFTEEDMLKYPQYFNAVAIFSSSIAAYISEETFKVLNKGWEKVYSWEHRFINFETIIRIVRDITYGNKVFTLDNLIYLKEKTGVSNKEFIDILKKYSDVFTDEKINKFIKTLGILS